jgi:predicted GNAT family acetyltransferase
MDLQVADQPGQHRIEIRADGELAGFVQYQLQASEIALTHTEIEDRFRRQGLGGRLVQAALDEARARDLAVLPYCPFVKNWISGHREYAGLVPADRRRQFGL